MLKRITTVICVTGLIISIGGCLGGGVGLAYEDDLVGDYAIWGTDLRTQAKVVLKDKKYPSSATPVTPAMIFAYGWNDDVIIAKQHPQKDREWKIDSSITNFFVIQVDSGTVHGPLNEKEFNETRVELGVSPELSFTKTVEP